MNAEPPLPKTRDEVEPRSHQFPMEEALKAMAILGLSFAVAAPATAIIGPGNVLAVMFFLAVQIGGGVLGFLVAATSSRQFQRETGSVLGLAYRDSRLAPPRESRKQLRLSVLAIIIGLEILAASFLIQSEPAAPPMLLAGVAGAFGGIALFHFRWNKVSPILEIRENGISSSPTHFYYWQEMRVWPGPYPDSIRVLYQGKLHTTRIETFLFFTSTELMRYVLKHHGGNPLADTSPDESPNMMTEPISPPTLPPEADA